MILLVSATNNTNLELAKEIEKIIISKNEACELISLEDYELPLYMASSNPENLDLKNLAPLHEKFMNAKGLVFFAPEYNGSVPPILSNAIAWISVAGGKDWRAAFNGKFSLICSNSGGVGNKLFNALKQQLEHLGSIVLPRSILTASWSPLKPESADKILTQLIGLIK